MVTIKGEIFLTKNYISKSGKCTTYTTVATECKGKSVWECIDTLKNETTKEIQKKTRRHWLIMFKDAKECKKK